MIYVPTVRNPIVEQMTIPHSSHLLNPSRFFWSFSPFARCERCVLLRRVQIDQTIRQEEAGGRKEKAGRSREKSSRGWRMSAKFFAESFRRSVLIPKCAITPFFFLCKNQLTVLAIVSVHPFGILFHLRPRSGRRRRRKKEMLRPRSRRSSSRRIHVV